MRKAGRLFKLSGCSAEAQQSILSFGRLRIGAFEAASSAECPPCIATCQPWTAGLPNRLPIKTEQQRCFATKAEEYDVITVDAGLARIEGYDAGGFLVNGAYLKGPIMCSGDLSTLWRVDTLATVTQDSLSLLLMMRPAPDLLVLGCGPRIQPLPAKLLQWLGSKGIAVECLDTGNAVSTFNILNQEGRKVAAALLPSNQ